VTYIVMMGARSPLANWTSEHEVMPSTVSDVCAQVLLPSITGGSGERMSCSSRFQSTAAHNGLSASKSGSLVCQVNEG
jgi:hypothetical protein